MKMNGCNELNGIFDVLTPFLAPFTGGGGGGGGAPAPSGPAGAGAGGTTISPVMQQEFTPQFSPVMQQTQDSPGATQAASPIQYATGGQRATTGMPGPGEPPGASYGMPSPVQPFADPFARMPTVQKSGEYTPIIVTGIVALAALAGVYMYQQGKKPRK